MIVAGDYEDDEPEARGESSRRKFGLTFPFCAVVGLVMLVVVLGVFLFGPRVSSFEFPNPVAEQAKLDAIAAHEFTVVRKSKHDGRVGAAGAEALAVPAVVSQPKKAEPVALTRQPDELQALRAKAVADVAAVRSLKQNGVVMETDPEAKALITQTQASLRALLRKEYGGDGPYYVQMDLSFPEAMPDYVSAGAAGSITIELAPIALVPYVVYYFLEMVKNYKSGAFHRNAGHVLQAMFNVKEDGERRGLAWQEYDPGFPHKKFTLGYAGRPGGPAFYISTLDNTDSHGPASQGSKTEADGCFGRVVRGRDVVKRMTKQPGKTKPAGFVDDSKNFIRITGLRLLPKGTKVAFDP